MKKLKNLKKVLIISSLFLLSIFLYFANSFLFKVEKNTGEILTTITEMETSIERIKFITFYNYVNLSENINYTYNLNREFDRLEELYKRIDEIANQELKESLNKVFINYLKDESIKNLSISKKIKIFKEKIVNLNQMIERIKSPLQSSIYILINDILPNPDIPAEAKVLAARYVYFSLQKLYGNSFITDEQIKKIRTTLNKYSDLEPLKKFLKNIDELYEEDAFNVLEKNLSAYIYDNSLIVYLDRLKERIKEERDIYISISSVLSLFILISFVLTILILYVLYLSSMRKIKEFIKIKEELESLVEKDELTELGNRLAFIKDKNQLKEPTLILVNIDNFKQINESYGTEIGDFLLKNLAKSIKKFLAMEGIDGKVYRLGADDFGILLDNRKDTIKEIVERLIKYIENNPFKYGDIYLPINVSVGVALSRPLFEKADMALRYVKESRKKYAIYTDEINIQDKILNKINIIKTIKRAIQEDKIFLVYQPIENLKTNQIEKYEVLVRMEDEKGRILYPAEFLEIAKGAKLYGEITKKVLEKTFKILEEYDVELSVNLSVEDITDENIRFLIRNHIKKPSLANRLTFEILEDMAIEEYKEEFKEFIDEMKVFGVKIAIDDFGSGYSNFAHILNLKPDFIKVDGSLIKEIDVKEQNRLVAETIVSFCKKLGIKTVAEFVWNKDVYETVKKIGFDYGQGFYISKPLMSLPEKKRKKEEN